MNVSRLPHIKVDKYGLELESHGTRAFLCGVYECDPLVNDMPWHWHPELEFVYVQRGTLVYAAAGRQFRLGAGDAAFVAGGVPHAEFPFQNQHVSEREAQRTFRQCTGDSPIAYLSYLRLRLAARMLRQSNEAVGSIAHSCGFDTQSYFNRRFRIAYGCTPLQWRQSE